MASAAPGPGGPAPGVLGGCGPVPALKTLGCLSEAVKETGTEGTPFGDAVDGLNCPDWALGGEGRSPVRVAHLFGNVWFFSSCHDFSLF